MTFWFVFLKISNCKSAKPSVFLVVGNGSILSFRRFAREERTEYTLSVSPSISEEWRMFFRIESSSVARDSFFSVTPALASREPK